MTFKLHPKDNPRNLSIAYLKSPWRRAWGAMFHRSLNGKALVFIYPHTAPRLFHTYFCPPMRVLALSEAGEILFDQAVSRRRFIRIPPTRLVVETSPEDELCREDLRSLAADAGEVQVERAAWQVEASFDRLLFSLLGEALADIRRVHEVHNPDGKISPAVLRKKFQPWERGQITDSASFILEYSPICDLPATAVRLSRQILRAEATWMDEITAASLAGSPWEADFPDHCLRCAQAASWRPVLRTPSKLAVEATWRYKRPENHFLLCRKCAHWLGWNQNLDMRVALAQGLWGMRFEAFQTWHGMAVSRRLPRTWDRVSFPLWPQAYGGETWETGSGARAHAEPRLPIGVCRTGAHRAALAQALNGRGGLRRAYARRQFNPWQPFLRLAGISPHELT